VSARSNTLRSPARSTTAAVTSKPSALHCAIAALAMARASCNEMLRSVSTWLRAVSGASATHYGKLTNVDVRGTSAPSNGAYITRIGLPDSTETASFTDCLRMSSRTDTR